METVFAADCADGQCLLFRLMMMVTSLCTCELVSHFSDMLWLMQVMRRLRVCMSVIACDG